MKKLNKLPFLLAALVTLVVAPHAKAADADQKEASLRFTVMQWVNLVEIYAGKLALTNSENADVRDYAKGAVDKHTKWAKDLGEFATKRGLKPVSITRQDATDLEKSLVALVKDAQALKELKGKLLDQAFAALMVKINTLSLKNLELASTGLRDTDEGRFLGDLVAGTKEGLDGANKLVEKVK